MDKKIKTDDDDLEIGEDTTKYGEFVCSYFAWLPPKSQKEKAKEMKEMTKKGGQKKDDI